MRLTLRTMLAYLDDVLDAGDAAALGEKIEESEFASSLVSRIRTTISQPRLSAPDVDGKGTGHDANSVAEYLDSTLPVDKVPDFERVCLASDAHLAEVAACHQILTLVLGKPAAVPAALRERAYRFGTSEAANSARTASGTTTISEEGHRLDQAHANASAQAGVEIGAETTEHEPEPKGASGVPGYLREGRRKSQLATLAVAACILLLLGGIGAFAAFTYFGGGIAQNDPGGNNPNANAPAAVEPQPAGDPAEETTPAPIPENTPPGEPVRPAPVADEPTTNGNPTVEPTNERERPLPPAEVPNVGETEPPPPVVPPSAPSIPGDPPEIPSDDPAVTPPAEPAPTEPPPVEPVTPPSDPEELSPIDVGRYLSGDKVLARMAPDKSWQRLPANATLRSGDRLLALPAFRPHIALSSGMTLTLDGSTRVNFLKPIDATIPRLDLEYGNVLAIAVNREGSLLGLKIRDLEGRVRLADANTMLAIEATPVWTPGATPLATQSPLEIRLICLSGRVDWIATDGTASPIAAGDLLTFVDGGLGQIAKLDVPPAWIDDKAVSLTDRDAARMLEQRLEADRPLELTLSEVAVGPRADLRSLAVRGLAYLDNHDTLISSLNDNSQRSSWAAEVDAVHHALARGTDSAAAVQKSLQSERSGTAAELFQLLVGFTQDDLLQGADSKLIEYLDHDSQEFRVLAIENLRRITGATHLYRPEYTPQRRKMYVQAWRADLEAGNIRYPESEPQP